MEMAEYIGINIKQDPEFLNIAAEVSCAFVDTLSNTKPTDPPQP